MSGAPKPKQINTSGLNPGDILVAGPNGVAVGQTPQDQGASQEPPTILRPGIQHFLGTLAGWTQITALPDDDIFYGKIYLPPGTYDRMECVIIDRTANNRLINMGIYADNGVDEPGAHPVNALLAETGPIDSNGNDQSLWRQPFTAPLVVSTGGFYWLAITQDGPGQTVRVAASHTFPEAFDGVTFKFQTNGAGNGAVLPANLGGSPTFDAPSASAFPYMGILEAP